MRWLLELLCLFGAVVLVTMLMPVFALGIMASRASDWFHEGVKVKKPDGSELSGAA